ncbi:hypothetical protein ACS0TY_024612 [Phlomoides rotata]
MIFRGLRVNLDERDISMDSAYKKELQRVLRENTISLPQVFINGKYIGGADVIRQLLEAGELPRLIKGLPLRSIKPCDACDDMRFIPCTNCNGSRKVFDEDEEQQKRCTDCNENGLVRCPLCLKCGRAAELLTDKQNPKNGIGGIAAAVEMGVEALHNGHRRSWSCPYFRSAPKFLNQPIFGKLTKAKDSHQKKHQNLSTELLHESNFSEAVPSKAKWSSFDVTVAN